MIKEQIIANWAQQMEDGIEVVVDVKDYDFDNEERLLIPFHKPMSNKIGLINRYGEIILNSDYDIILDKCYSTEDLLRIGQLYSFGFSRPNGNVDIYTHYKYGVIDSLGNFILNINYREILISDDKQLFSLRDLELRWEVIDRNGNIIVPFGKYDVIGRFWKGFARVHKTDNHGGGWGVIDTSGREVIPTRYKTIYDFYGKDYSSIYADGEYIPFEELSNDTTNSI